MNHVATKAWVLAGVAGGMVTAIGLALLFARLFLVAPPLLIRPPPTPRIDTARRPRPPRRNRGGPTPPLSHRGDSATRAVALRGAASGPSPSRPFTLPDPRRLTPSAGPAG